MFTGIITSMGVFGGFRLGRREIWVEDPGLGPENRARATAWPSTAICLTLVRREAGSLVFDVCRETLDRTTLGLAPARGPALNLELPVTPSSLHRRPPRLRARRRRGKGHPPDRKGRGKRLSVSFPAEMRPYFVPKGSVAVNGVSLTIAGLGPARRSKPRSSPRPSKTPIWGASGAGDPVNLECDIVGKYVYNFACETPWKRKAQ